MMGVSRCVKDIVKRPMKLRSMSECMNEPLKPREEENPPGRTQVYPSDLGDEADTSTASWTIEDVGNRSRKLRETSEHEQECSEEEANSPGRPGEEPDEPGSETAVPGDPITYQEGPTGGASEASTSDQDIG